MVSTRRVRRGRRWLVGGLVAISVLLVAGLIVRSVVLRDRARVVPADEALEVFRQETTTTVAAASTTTPIETTSTVAALPPTLPEQGIYRYRTTGSESIDALGGTKHDYPAETTITVIGRGCGVGLRWDALRERRDEWALCATVDGIELQAGGDQYHEFFSQPDDEAVSCDRTVVLVPVAAAAGGTSAVRQSCTLAVDPWLPQWEILERSTRSIDGVDVGVQHVRMTIDDNDSYAEHTTIDWYLADSGLPVEVRAIKASASPSPIGAVNYDEQYHLELISTTPLQ